MTTFNAGDQMAEYERLDTPAPEGEVVGDPVLWKDRPDEWTDAILAVHPVNSTDPERHNRFALAMKMVGNRHGKYELVGLVHWLLTRLDEASPVVAVGVADLIAALVEGQGLLVEAQTALIGRDDVCMAEDGSDAIAVWREKVRAILKATDTGREGA